MKNNKLQESIISIKTDISDSSKNYPVSSSKGKCYQLFFSCFKVVREKNSQESFDKSQECDYIVEKLIVKRVPFISFRSPENTVETNSDQLDEKNGKVSTAVEENTIFSDASKTQSILYCYDSLNQNRIINNSPSTYLYFDRNTSELHGRKTNILTTGYSSRIEDVTNSMSNLHPDLKECEKLPKAPCSYSHKPKNKTIFGTSTKVYNQKHIKSSDSNELQCSWEIPTNKYEVLAENTASTGCTDPSNITLRWKIILKQCKPNKEYKVS
ncbi:uncharacterized protein LOC143213426 [Lasioglossum baleicum]|uniref:uncharacterized protein LOC143213426 n=1 Tax=Lasioglossum baleicum TaxID=434251 RepID=UPI003FCE43DB